MSPELIHRLSFTHLTELIQLPDATQRRFYELECIRGNWSVRELRRQIDSLYYQRSGLSKIRSALTMDCFRSHIIYSSKANNYPMRLHGIGAACLNM